MLPPKGQRRPELELISPAPAAGLFMNKIFIRGLLDQCGYGSLLPVGDNCPHTYSLGWEFKRGGTRSNLRSNTHTSLSATASVALPDNKRWRTSESPRKWCGYKCDLPNPPLQKKKKVGYDSSLCCKCLALESRGSANWMGGNAVTYRWGRWGFWQDSRKCTCQPEWWRHWWQTGPEGLHQRGWHEKGSPHLHRALIIADQETSGSTWSNNSHKKAGRR